MSNLVALISKQGVKQARVGRSVPTQKRGTTKRREVGGRPAVKRVDSRAGQENLSWVLLLDDDPMNTRGLSRWLKQTFGIETRSARTIQQAECWLASMPTPRAIISDFDLEGMDTAVTALGRFRSLGVHCRTLVLTGAPSRARAALLDAGWSKTPVLSKANFQGNLTQWLQESVAAQRRLA
jgi:CheY-like chemotaxis protein